MNSYFSPGFGSQMIRGTPQVAAPRIDSPSALSILMARHGSLGSPLSQGSGPDAPLSATSETKPTPFMSVSELRQAVQPAEPIITPQSHVPSLASPRDGIADLLGSPFADDTPTPRPRSPMHDTEHTPLLPSRAPRLSTPNLFSYLSRHFPRPTTKRALSFVSLAAKSLPAVLLGALLNILDGVSYGLIIFPPAAVFEGFGGIGVSMFFVTTVAAQLIYTFGASSFAGANGSMIIEVVPFFHMIAISVIQELGGDNADPQAVVATTLAAFSLSSILTGVAFFILGYFKLGNLISFFPRHILIGCIGGVGWFLIETGLEVCGGLKEESFNYTLDQFKYFFLNAHVVSLWLPAFLLATLLRVITHRWSHQLIFPLYFIIICVIFYIVVAIGRFDLQTLRNDGWIFNMGETSSDPWWTFYTYYNFSKTSLYCLWVTLPTQLALLFFNLLHPPLNIPALSISLNEEVDTNKELVAHGYSNFLAGMLGAPPNYVVYVNSLLFYRVGGGNRLAGFLLAMATFVLLIVGTAPISYIPVMVVGALIFVLGIDLVKEAIWDTRNRVSRLEYITIWSIIGVMSVWDFVTGVIFGIVVCCFFFVIQNSQARSIRALYSGVSAMSVVRRPWAHREYLRQVAQQTAIMKLQGFIFFGTITKVEDAVKDMLEAYWKSNPIRFLVLDMSLVLGVDMSSAEALLRLQRLLAAKSVMLVFCGISKESIVARSLQMVNIFGEENVELFDSVDEAIEWTENAYLRAWFVHQGTWDPPVLDKRAVPPVKKPPIVLGESYASSPRRSQLFSAGQRVINNGPEAASFVPTEEPVPTLVKVFWSLTETNAETFQPLLPYLHRTPIPEGYVLWRQGDPPDGLYFVESGLLRASYDFGSHAAALQELMVAGTISGELSALAGMPRNATVVAERASLLWRLSMEDLARIEMEQPELARMFTKMVLKVAKVETDFLTASLAGRS